MTQNDQTRRSVYCVLLATSRGGRSLHGPVVVSCGQLLLCSGTLNGQFAVAIEWIHLKQLFSWLPRGRSPVTQATENNPLASSCSDFSSSGAAAVERI